MGSRKQTNPPQVQDDQPGSQRAMRPQPESIRDGYTGSGKLEGRVALISGGDSGIGRAVAVHFAREGADVAIAYLDEEEDARCTRDLVEAEGRRCVTMAGDLGVEDHARAVVERTVRELGGGTLMKRPGQPSEVAPSYVFLAAEDASFITGQVLHVNGGSYMSA